MATFLKWLNKYAKKRKKIQTVTDLEKIHYLGENLKVLRNSLRDYLGFGEIWNLI